MMRLKEDQIERYSRQILLPNVGGKGQEKLLDSKVLVIGAGGLGSPAALYLAAAGIGKLGIVDSDAVELSNLHRQILHSTKDLGIPKVESAKATLNALNPDVEVVPHKLRISSENIMEIFKEYDIILDGSDNFATKYLVNDACVLSDKPLSHGGIFRLDGQTITILPKKSACYRCVFAEPPPPGLVPSCQQVGVLGAVAGIIGIIQANEVIKYILDTGDLLTGRLLVFNGLSSSFRQVKVPKDPKCPVCGEDPSVTKLIDYEQFCQVKPK
jgi:adenylyltransferase/sulfurtransferase